MSIKRTVGIKFEGPETAVAECASAVRQKVAAFGVQEVDNVPCKMECGTGIGRVKVVIEGRGAYKIFKEQVRPLLDHPNVPGWKAEMKLESVSL